MKNLTGVALLLLPLIVAFGCGDDSPTKPTTFSGAVTQDAWCKVQPSICCNNCIVPGSMVLSVTNASTTVTGDGILVIEISGDLDDVTDENLTISVEGLDLGIVFNGNTNDDSFDLPNDMIQDCVPTTIEAALPETQLKTIVADGVIEVSLTPGSGNNDIEDDGCPDTNDETITVRVSYPIG